ITNGSDGKLWFGAANATLGQIGRMTTAGVVTFFTVPTFNPSPYGITAGPDSNIWFTDTTGNHIGRLVPPSPATVPAVSLVGLAVCAVLLLLLMCRLRPIATA